MVLLTPTRATERQQVRIFKIHGTLQRSPQQGPHLDMAIQHFSQIRRRTLPQAVELLVECCVYQLKGLFQNRVFNGLQFNSKASQTSKITDQLRRQPFVGQS